MVKTKRKKCLGNTIVHVTTTTDPGATVQSFPRSLSLYSLVSLLAFLEKTDLLHYDATEHQLLTLHPLGSASLMPTLDLYELSMPNTKRLIPVFFFARFFEIKFHFQSSRYNDLSKNKIDEQSPFLAGDFYLFSLRLN